MKTPLCHQCIHGLFALNVFCPHKSKTQMGCALDSRINNYEQASILCSLLEPATVEVKAEVKREFLNRTPAEWCAHFGVSILDPDGWDRSDPQCMAYCIPQDDFIKKWCVSTGSIANKAKFAKYQHLFR